MPKTINHEFWWAYAKVEVTELTNLSIILAILPCHNFLPTTPKMAFSCSSLGFTRWPGLGYTRDRLPPTYCGPELWIWWKMARTVSLWALTCLLLKFWFSKIIYIFIFGKFPFLFCFFPLSSCLYLWLCGNLCHFLFSLKSSPIFTVSVPVPLPWLFLLSFSFNSYHQNVVMRSVFKCPSLTSVQPGISI